jgi:oligoendopeptidase F
VTSLLDVKLRKDQPKESLWDVEALYPTIENWEKDLASFSSPSKPHFPTLEKFKGRLAESPQVLKEALDTLNDIARKCDKLYTFAHLKHDEETTEDTYKSAHQKICSLAYLFGEEVAWFDPEIIALDQKVFDSFIKSPELEPYRFYLEKTYRLKPHTLPKEQEELLALSSQALSTPGKAFSSLNNSDLDFGHVEDGKGKIQPLTHGSYGLFLRSSDRTLRKNAFEKMYHTFQGVENTMGDLLYGLVQSHIFSAKARKYSSPLEAALFPKNIPLSVYYSLIKAVREKLPCMHRYMKVRKEKLGVSELHHYDLYAPLVPDMEMHMSYQEAEDVVIESVAPLGKEYQAILEKGMREERWVDQFENKHKRSGAYSSGCYDSYPYILMNYKGILRDVFTLAHEAGHSMHSYLSHHNQSYQDSHYPIFVAEVASTFNEELLGHLLMERTNDPKKRLFLINEKIEDIRATLFRQTMFAEFELKIHEICLSGEPLTPNRMKEIYKQLNRDYFGPEVCEDPLIEIEWARIPHFYYNFYVYQYATGISAALSLSNRVLSGDEQARDNYLKFLKGGGSLFPIDLLKLAGIDMTSAQPVIEAIDVFDSLIKEFESLSK